MRSRTQRDVSFLVTAVSKLSRLVSIIYMQLWSNGETEIERGLIELSRYRYKRKTSIGKMIVSKSVNIGQSYVENKV